MEATPDFNFTIHHAQFDDIPNIAQLSADSFQADRQTQMKALGKEPFDMKADSLLRMPNLMRNPRCVILKAVDSSSGAMVGHCAWGFRGFQVDKQLLPEREGEPPADDSANRPRSTADVEPGPDSGDDPIKRLEAFTGRDMEAWMADVMPDGVPCMYIVGLSVAPGFQGRGIGSALLRWGTRICDERRVFAWVHSSEPAWRMYEKCGFQTIRSLDIDLDEYAPVPPPDEGPGAKWGHYVFRYMKYLPKASDSSSRDEAETRT
ncbi:hypothetical protein HIM_08233 [Hirsutella minnesotensis 3608]|uniref:N-acetyltransferase domain-containing protein n=1 Tax=Hirsutella minnesotensis 3608 TaxID=1043627 RepID=A0A0F7ZMQ9_9HYPO|nr:hypothetical protein HIM_08233 [Hirsutella minnesotensis 3608]